MLLVLDDDGVACDGGREAALGTYGELLQRVVSGGFPDAGFELFGDLAVGGLRGDEAEYDGFVFRDVVERFEGSRAFVVLL